MYSSVVNIYLSMTKHVYNGFLPFQYEIMTNLQNVKVPSYYDFNVLYFFFFNLGHFTLPVEGAL